MRAASTSGETRTPPSPTPRPALSAAEPAGVAPRHGGHEGARRRLGGGQPVVRREEVSGSRSPPPTPGRPHPPAAPRRAPGPRPARPGRPAAPASRRHPAAPTARRRRRYARRAPTARRGRGRAARVGPVGEQAHRLAQVVAHGWGSFLSSSTHTSRAPGKEGSGGGLPPAAGPEARRPSVRGPARPVGTSGTGARAPHRSRQHRAADDEQPRAGVADAGDDVGDVVGALVEPCGQHEHRHEEDRQRPRARGGGVGEGEQGQGAVRRDRGADVARRKLWSGTSPGSRIRTGAGRARSGGCRRRRSRRCRPRRAPRRPAGARCDARRRRPAPRAPRRPCRPGCRPAGCRRRPPPPARGALVGDAARETSSSHPPTEEASVWVSSQPTPSTTATSTTQVRTRRPRWPAGPGRATRARPGWSWWRASGQSGAPGARSPRSAAPTEALARHAEVAAGADWARDPPAHDLPRRHDHPRARAGGAARPRRPLAGHPHGLRPRGRRAGRRAAAPPGLPPGRSGLGGDPAHLRPHRARLGGARPAPLPRRAARPARHGRSTPIGEPADLGATPQEQADRLALFRADAIVADAELLRAHLGVERWSVLGHPSAASACCTTSPWRRGRWPRATSPAGCRRSPARSTTSTPRPTRPSWSATGSSTSATPPTATVCDACTTWPPRAASSCPAATG